MTNQNNLVPALRIQEGASISQSSPNERGSAYGSTRPPRTPECTTAGHAPLKADPYWKTLPFRGIQEPDLELRECPACGSTLARELDHNE